MKTAIAIITYRRPLAVRYFVESIQQHMPDVTLAIFEDCGSDETTQWLRDSGVLVGERWQAEHWQAPSWSAYLGKHNLGVSGNSNRALAWFATTDCDHLILCNDDLAATGDFAAFYAAAHHKLGVGFLCFNDFTDEVHRPVPARSKRGTLFNLVPRITGIAMSITRRCFEAVGYFEADVFGRFGEEHVSWTHRARFAGQIVVEGAECVCVDMPGAPLRHQDVLSTCNAVEKPLLDQEASEAMGKAASRYPYTQPWRGFTLGPRFLPGDRGGPGIDPWVLQRVGYELVA